MKLLNNKVALVTGATSGIGEATIKLLVENGAKVVLVGRNEERGKLLENQILQNGGDAFFIITDVSDEQQVITMVKIITEK